MYMKTQVLRCGMYTCMNILTHAHTHDCIGGVCWLVCFFLLWPLFCSCPASLVSRKFFAVGPGCAKCFFFCCALLGAATFRRGQSKKKNTTQGVFFFCCGPGERQGKEKPRWKPARGQSKKKKDFLLWPRAGAQRGFSFPCLSPGPQPKKKTPWVVFLFCSGPVPASNGASPSLAFRRGRSKKKNTLGGVFFFALAPCRLPTGLLLPLPFAGAAAKKKSPWVVFFFFCCGPARTLTHSLRAWVAMPPPRRGGVFFFAAAPPGPGWCFVSLLWPRPDAHSLTVGWGDFGKARVVFFFLLRPRRVFLDNSKKCLGYYIGSKKTRRGHSKKKHHFRVCLYKKTYARNKDKTP